jgi:DNA-binding response OmpR family regulator
MTSQNHDGPRAAHRILIVDDERRNRQLLEVVLGAEGYALESATGGEEALRLVAARPPDLVLLDIMMPGMNGYQVAAAIKADAATRHVLVVMLSALDDRNSRAHGLHMGADAFLAKPVNRAEVCDLVRSLLAARPMTAPA